MKIFSKILHYFITLFIYLIQGLLLTYLTGWCCDNLFDTDLLDRFWILYVLIVLVIPLLKNYFKIEGE